MLTASAPPGSKTATLKVLGNIPPNATFLWDFGDGKKELTRTGEIPHTYEGTVPGGTGSRNSTFDDGAFIPYLKFNASVEIRDEKKQVMGTAKTEVVLNAIRTISSQPKK
jgi:hypothetical protein